jgi:hypothetical protein
MKYLTILVVLALWFVYSIDTANASLTSGQSIVKACEGRSDACIEQETLCRAGDQSACAARQKEEKKYKKQK